MFLKSLTQKRAAYKLLTMHKVICSEFEKQLRATLSSDSLTIKQQGEIVLFLTFAILKSIEVYTSNKDSFTALSSNFLDHLLKNEGDYGIEGELREYVLDGISNSRLGEYENTDTEELAYVFYKNIDQPLVADKSEIIGIVELNFVIIAKEAEKIVQ